MNVKPDIRFTKLHTAKGTFYSFEVFIGYEKTYFGKGRTINEAAENLYKQYNDSINEIDQYLDFLDKFGSDINAIEVKNKLDDYHFEKGDIPQRQCAFCGAVLPHNKKGKYCSKECQIKHQSRKAYLRNKARRIANANKAQEEQ